MPDVDPEIEQRVREISQLVNSLLDSGNTPSQAVGHLMAGGLDYDTATTIVNGVVELRQRQPEPPDTTESLPDYYEALQVSPSAEAEVVEAAYKRLAFKYHPDRNADPGSSKRMQSLNEAYSVLIDPERRKQYDAWRSSQADESRASPENGQADPDTSFSRSASAKAADRNPSHLQQLVVAGMSPVLGGMVLFGIAILVWRLFSSDGSIFKVTLYGGIIVGMLAIFTKNEMISTPPAADINQWYFDQFVARLLCGVFVFVLFICL